MDEDLALLKQFDFGKPIVIGETFPLSCGLDDERSFLLNSRGIAVGWIAHWPDNSPAQLADLKKSGKLTPAQTLWHSWIDLFRQMAPEMTRTEEWPKR